MIKINSKTGLMLIASCGAALGLVGVSFLNNASTKVYATGGTTTKSVVYDATNNKTSADGTFIATAASSMHMTGLSTTISTSNASPDYAVSGAYETVKSYDTAGNDKVRYGVSQCWTFTTSGTFTSVAMTFSCNAAVGNPTYLPHVSIGGTKAGNFVSTYPTAGTEVSGTVAITASSVQTVNAYVLFASGTAFTFTLKSLTVSFTSAATC